MAGASVQTGKMSFLKNQFLHKQDFRLKFLPQKYVIFDNLQQTSVSDIINSNILEINKYPFQTLVT